MRTNEPRVWGRDARTRHSRAEPAPSEGGSGNPVRAGRTGSPLDACLRRHDEVTKALGNRPVSKRGLTTEALRARGRAMDWFGGRGREDRLRRRSQPLGPQRLRSACSLRLHLGSRAVYGVRSGDCIGRLRVEPRNVLRSVPARLPSVALRRVGFAVASEEALAGEAALVFELESPGSIW